MSLGEVDYGLMGLVGGLTAFVVFFNDLLAGAVSRYYAVSVGHAKTSGEEGIAECRDWFCTALFVHSVLSVALLIVGYYVGLWAVRHFLAIPNGRVEACIWVWRFTCVSCFVGMLNVPFRAMYIAKQYIAELTIYSFATTVLNFGAAYYMATHPGEWLAKYALWTCLLSVVPNLIICGRAITIFQECRGRLSQMINPKRLCELGRYVSFRFIGALSSMLQSQGNSILVNKFLGARFNATMTVGNTMAAHVVSLSTAMSGAIGPAIFNAYGSGDKERMSRLVACASKIGAVLYLVFMLPVILEISELFSLWLASPPPWASFIGICVLLAYLTERISDGEVNAIYATGNIKHFQLVLSACCLFGLCVCGILLRKGLGMIGVGVSIVLFKSMIMVGRVVFSSFDVGLPARHWFKKVFVPVLAASSFGFMAGCSTRLFMPASVFRILVTTVQVEIVFIPSIWMLVLNADERRFLLARVKSIFNFNKVHP